jgi:flagellar biosynthesis protein FliQ
LIIIWEDEMTEEIQNDPGTEKDQGDNGGDVENGVRKYAGIIGGLMIVAGAVMSLVLAFKKIQKLALWFVPTALYIVGTFLVAQAGQERKEKIEATQEEIVSMLDELDPVAKAQVAAYVAEAELGKR